MYMSHERRAYILKRLEQQGCLRSADLARELEVTDETIRTDLVALQKKGLLQRVHGGARYIPPGGSAEAVEQRLDCRMAACLTEGLLEGMILFLDASPFSLSVAWLLRERPCRLYVTSLRLMSQLGAQALPHRIFAPGGEMDKKSGLFIAEPDLPFFAGVELDAAVLHPQSLAEGTIGYQDAMRAAWAASAIGAAKRCLVAAPALILGTEAACSIPCTPDLMVTEAGAPEPYSTRPNVRTVPSVYLEELLPPDRFDY